MQGTIRGIVIGVLLTLLVGFLIPRSSADSEELVCVPGHYMQGRHFICSPRVK